MPSRDALRRSGCGPSRRRRSRDLARTSWTRSWPVVPRGWTGLRSVRSAFAGDALRLREMPRLLRVLASSESRIVADDQVTGRILRLDRDDVLQVACPGRDLLRSRGRHRVSAPCPRGARGAATVLIDREGRIAARAAGAISAVDLLLSEPAARTPPEPTLIPGPVPPCSLSRRPRAGRLHPGRGRGAQHSDPKQRVRLRGGRSHPRRHDQRPRRKRGDPPGVSYSSGSVEKLG